MFAVTSDGQSLMVDAKWLRQLQEQVMGEDQLQHKPNPEEVLSLMDLGLEWVYGSNLNAGKASTVALQQLY
jgi:hypothetical protein